MTEKTYVYNAYVEKIYDADTITCTIDCGFSLSMKRQKIRLHGINAPEVRGVAKKAGIAARDHLRRKILHKNVLIKTFKDKKGKYGRYLGTVFLEKENINDWLVEMGTRSWHSIEAIGSEVSSPFFYSGAS